MKFLILVASAFLVGAAANATGIMIDIPVAQNAEVVESTSLGIHFDAWDLWVNTLDMKSKVQVRCVRGSFAFVDSFSLMPDGSANQFSSILSQGMMFSPQNRGINCKDYLELSAVAINAGPASLVVNVDGGIVTVVPKPQ